MNFDQETLYAVALTRISHFNIATGRQLYRLLGSATAIMEHRHDIRAVLHDVSPRIEGALKDVSEAMRRAEEELEFDEAHSIQPLTINHPDYPERLRQCDDAPLVLYYRGSANINKRRILAIVGTRHCSAYGQAIIHNFTRDLKTLCPEAIIVSGLAYGVDINAHRNALKKNIETIGVLAHGLDYLYPTAHRDTAAEMLSHGGLATEFMTNTNPDKMNFVRRNRIIAGLADATIVIESANKGGSLITTEMANGYGRDVFAFPGNVGMPYSEGCNKLIRLKQADLITSAEDFVNAMMWDEDRKLSLAKKNGIERQLFPELEPDESTIMQLLAQQNDLPANTISLKTGLTIAATTAAIFSMEMKGVVKTMAGGVVHLFSC